VSRTEPRLTDFSVDSSHGWLGVVAVDREAEGWEILAIVTAHGQRLHFAELPFGDQDAITAELTKRRQARSQRSPDGHYGSARE
jgi:hypothetical protein